MFGKYKRKMRDNRDEQDDAERAEVLQEVPLTTSGESFSESTATAMTATPCPQSCQTDQGLSESTTSLLVGPSDQFLELRYKDTDDTDDDDDAHHITETEGDALDWSTRTFPSYFRTKRRPGQEKRPFGRPLSSPRQSPSRSQSSSFTWYRCIYLAGIFTLIWSVSVIVYMQSSLLSTYTSGSLWASVGMTSATVVHSDSPMDGSVHRQQLAIEPSTEPSSISNTSTASDSATTAHSLLTSSSVDHFPPWMAEYFHWHREQRQLLNETNWQEKIDDDNFRFKFLVMRCLKIDAKCGGTSDRLHSIPLAILIAYKTNRILLIQWERPYPLEEFLLPPLEDATDDTPVLDWRVPDFINFNYRPRPDITATSEAKRKMGSKKQMMDMRHQSHDHGSNYYNEYVQQQNELAGGNGTHRAHLYTWSEVYHDVWSRVFTPSPPVAKRIAATQSALHLYSSGYVAAHIRSQYTSDRVENKQMISNAIRCAWKMSHNDSFVSELTVPHQHKSPTEQVPIFVAADSVNVTKWAVEYGRRYGQRVVSSTLLDHDKEDGHHDADRQLPDVSKISLHLDRGSNFLSAKDPDWMDHPPSSYYDSFVDLYMLAMGRCVTFHIGGFGRWAAILTGGHCGLNHGKTKCEWDLEPTTSTS